MQSPSDDPVQAAPSSVLDMLADGLASDQSSSTPRMEKAIASLISTLSTTTGNLATLIRGLPLDRRRPLAKLTSISTYLQAMPLNAVSPELASGFSSHVEQAVHHLRSIAAEDPRKHPEELPAHYSNTISQVMEHAGQAEHLGYEIAGVLAATVVVKPELVEGAIRAQRHAIHEGAVQVATMLGEAEQLLKGTRESVQSSTLAAHAEVFGSEGRAFAVQAGGWLAATVILLLVTGMLACWNLAQAQDPRQPTALAISLQVIAAKVFIAGILIASIRAALAQYRAARHNAVVNQHRSRALQSFNALVQAAPDPQTKAAVLLQATNGVFSPQPTGYLGRDFEQVASAPTLHDAARVAQSSQGA